MVVQFAVITLVSRPNAPTHWPAVTSDPLPPGGTGLIAPVSGWTMASADTTSSLCLSGEDVTLMSSARGRYLPIKSLSNRRPADPPSTPSGAVEANYHQVRGTDWRRLTRIFNLILFYFIKTLFIQGSVQSDYILFYNVALLLANNKKPVDKSGADWYIDDLRRGTADGQ